MMKTAFFAVLVVVILIAVGCSESPSGTSGKSELPSAQAPNEQSLLDPCSLLTQAEASEIMGIQAGPAELQETGNIMGMRICQWEPADELEMGLIQVSVLQTEGIGPVVRARGMTAEKIFNETKNQMSPESVAGIGDDAFWTGSDLTFLKDGIQFSVSAGSKSIVKKGDQGLPAAKRVAAMVLPRL